MQAGGNEAGKRVDVVLVRLGKLCADVPHAFRLAGHAAKAAFLDQLGDDEVVAFAVGALREGRGDELPEAHGAGVVDAQVAQGLLFGLQVHGVDVLHRARRALAHGDVGRHVRLRPDVVVVRGSRLGVGKDALQPFLERRLERLALQAPEQEERPVVVF
ncbi:MAG: hypothetical protein CL678_00080 [Bdellovibrionaceae bacterium]|nr:hypothetical protein [Pseudobdellovibrionaceae bacterium]